MGLGHHRAVAWAICDGYGRAGLLEARAQVGIHADPIALEQQSSAQPVGWKLERRHVKLVQRLRSLRAEHKSTGSGVAVGEGLCLEIARRIELRVLQTGEGAQLAQERASARGSRPEHDFVDGGALGEGLADDQPARSDTDCRYALAAD